MNVLAFDTCFDACSVAVGRRLRSLTPDIVFTSEPMQTGHAERLMPMIEEAMADAGLAFADIDRIAIANGPGTFTGARISVAAARALALATGAEIVSLSSLHLMAMNPTVGGRGVRRIVIATDARRGEVYIQAFDAHSLEPLNAPQVLSINDAALAAGAGRVVIAGSGASEVAQRACDTGTDAVAILPGLVPEAIDMLFASMTMAVSPRVSPFYLRPPDAKPPAASSFSGIHA